MKLIKIVFFTMLLSLPILAQSDLEKLVAAEKFFAQTAADKNIKTAFLEFSADEAINFSPNPVNTKEFWNSRQATSALLAWTPEFADISANGVLGYTTGPWEFRPKGKDDNPAGFGHYVTVWQKQPDGSFKWVLDIGINHPKLNLSDIWTAPRNQIKELTEIKSTETVQKFFETAEKNGLEKAYKTFAADDIRLYRQDKIPFIGKKDALAEVKKNQVHLKVAKRTIFTTAQDLAYLSNPYTLLDKDGKELEKGNFLQIWKLRNGKWQLVLDLFNPIPKQ
jgi:ketosteroid isomerase-like protein